MEVFNFLKLLDPPIIKLAGSRLLLRVSYLTPLAYLHLPIRLLDSMAAEEYHRYK